MSEIDAARQSVRASLLLIFGNLTSTIISTLAVFVIARYLGPEQYGLYSLALAPVSIFILLSGVGMNTAITRYSAYYLSRGEVNIARRMNGHAVEFLLLIGSLLTLISYVAAEFISTSILHRPEATQYVQLSSFTILGQVILQCTVASFIGWASAGYASLSNIAQSVR